MYVLIYDYGLDSVRKEGEREEEKEEKGREGEEKEKEGTHKAAKLVHSSLILVLNQWSASLLSIFGPPQLL